MWRKGNSCVLFLELQISAATKENIMERPQKMKIELPCDYQLHFLELIFKSLFLELALGFELNLS